MTGAGMHGEIASSMPAAAAGVAAGLAVGLSAAALASVDRASVRAALSADAGAREAGASARSASHEWFRRIRAGCICVSSVLVGWMAAGVPGALAGGAACVAVPRARRRRAARAELAAMEQGLADAVSAVAAGLRAGRSVVAAFEEAAATVSAPLGPVMRSVADRVALGVPFEQALEPLGDAFSDGEGRLVVAILGLHKRSGGDAPAVLDRVARTLRERRAVAREVRSLTAQARLSGAILGFLPIGFFLFLAVTARPDLERALRSSAGLTAVLVGLAMQGAAFLWIRTLLRIEA